MKNFLREKEIHFTETENFSEGIESADVLYVTRVQKERFTDSTLYEKLNKKYTIAKESIKNAPKDIIIMHPGPRINEIEYEMDSLNNATYFRQTGYGLSIRMAILYLLSKE